MALEGDLAVLHRHHPVADLGGLRVTIITIAMLPRARSRSMSPIISRASRAPGPASGSSSRRMRAFEQIVRSTEGTSTPISARSRYQK